ncbi:MAG: DNA ligase-associated DEXH box helicase, partial [Rhodospirillales bacterium]
PLVISDHADWDDLLKTCAETQASKVWITHGREDALAFALSKQGQEAIPLRLSGREEESE